MAQSAIPLTAVADATRWNDYVALGGGHILQTFEWGEFKRRFGWSVERVAMDFADVGYGAAQVMYRRLAPGMTVGYIPRGPCFGQSSPPEILQFLSALVRRAQDRGAFLLKIEPNLPYGDALEQSLRDAGFQPSSETIQPPCTIQIDLERSLEQILNAMKPKWRYNIRLAERKGVRVRIGTHQDLPAFYSLLRLTGERDRFSLHQPEYYQTAFDMLVPTGRAALLVAEYDSKPLAMIFVTAFSGEAIYLYGASSNEERNRMPNHALHWHAIQWAKERGCTRYDLWGIPENIAITGEDGVPADGEESILPSSLYRFKQGFGGKVVRYLGAWDLVFDPLRHSAFRVARRIRRGGWSL